MRVLSTALLLACSACAWAQAPTAGGVAPRSDGAEAQEGSVRIRVTALTDDILRVRIAPEGHWSEDASWVVSPEARHRSIHVRADSGAKPQGFRTANLTVRFEHHPLRLIVENSSGQMLSADAAADPLHWHGAEFTLRKQLTLTEHIVGLGDKAGPLDRRGEAFVNWNTDAYGFQESTDPLYKSIPFLISVGSAGGSYGIYLDNTWRSWFDLGRRDADTLEIGADGGPIDYYFIYGPTVRHVVEGYASLAGRAPLPPLWAFGYQQCRYSYMSADEVRAVAARLRTEHIPTDVMWLDIDYQDRYRPFTVNAVTFPDFPGLIRDLKAQGLHAVAITDLHIADAPDQGYAPYDSGVAGDDFVKRPDGSRFVAEVWPGVSVFPDFTRASSRAWWGGLYRDFVADGIAGFWNDMNEPALFKTATKTMPLDIQHRIEEPGFAARTATHAEIHNIYGMENSRATYEGLLKLAPDERPFVMTRASFAGGQRYAVTWTGDNSSTWNHLKLVVPQLLNLGLSGFTYSGADVGGFAGEPSPELMTRWIEIAAFTPIFRAHSAKGFTGKEPWTHGADQLGIRRHYIEERYRLLPYIYALADESARTGVPLMRPVFFDYPDALSAPCDASTTFLLGHRLLVAPPPDLDSPAEYLVCLPAGGWYDYWSGMPVEPASVNADGKSADELKLTPALERLPVFVRAGSIVPHQPLVQSTAEIPDGPLTLDVYPGENCHGNLYADDGHSLAYLQGAYLRQTVRCRVTSNGVDVSFEPRDGKYQPWWHTIALVVHGWKGSGTAEFGGSAPAVALDPAAQTLRLQLPDQPTAAEIHLRH